VIAVLLVEKTHFSKSQVEKWTTKLQDIPLKTLKQCGSTTCHPNSPHKQHVLGEKGNTLLVDVDPCEEMLNAQPSAEEEWLWAQMSVGDCQLKLPPMMEGVKTCVTL